MHKVLLFRKSEQKCLILRIFFFFYAGIYSRNMRSTLSSKFQKDRCHLSFLKTLKEMKKERYKRTYEKEKVDPCQIERKIEKW